MNQTPTVRIDGDRLWTTLLETAQFGATPGGGVTRLTLSDADRQMRDWLRAACEAAGCHVTVDDMGNIFGRRAGRNPALPPIGIGSHLDTQPSGGKFDGILGVLAGLELIRTLNDHAIETEAPIEVIDWTNEEGSRFTPGMMASGVFAGVVDAAFAHGRIDRVGVRFGDELMRIGYLGAEPCGSHRLGAHFELHIEQGPILEAEGITIGVVTGVQASRWFEVTVTGVACHAGSTPMRLRHDALVGAAKMVGVVDEVGRAHGPHAVATVGVIEPRPGSRNVVPGAVFFTIDLRVPSDATLAAMEAAIRERFARIAAEDGLGLAIEQVFDSPAVHFNPDCIDAVQRAADACGYTSRAMISGAGHDSAYIARVAPSGMIFVTSVNGLSHNEAEHTDKDDIAAGANVLLQAVLDYDRRLAEK